MQDNSSLISNIHKSRETVTVLMERQGYDVSDYKNITLTETNAKYMSDQLDMLFAKNSNPDKSIKKTYVNFYLGKSLRPNYIQETIDDLFEIESVLTKEDTLMIVIKEDPHDTITNALKHIWEKDGYFVIVENIKRLQYNLLDHSLVPAHRILTDEEVTVMKNKYNAKNSVDLPDISRFDPVCRAIGMRPGDICEITRASKNSIYGVYYRVCV